MTMEPRQDDTSLRSLPPPRSIAYYAYFTRILERPAGLTAGALWPHALQVSSLVHVSTIANNSTMQ